MVKIKSKRKSKTKKTKRSARNTKRLEPLGLHPGLSGDARNPLGPGQYDPRLAGCPYQTPQPIWDRQQRTEAFSKFLGYKNDTLLQERAYLQSLGGPGHFEVPANTVDQGATFGKDKRFRAKSKNDAPPPGSHNINPPPNTKFGKVPMFEWDGFAQRTWKTPPSFQPAPNRYDVKAPSLLKKKVTKRGPYDCFTGPRDAKNMNNHFAAAKIPTPDRFYNINSNLDVMLNHPDKRRYGKFLKAERFPKGLRLKVTNAGGTLYERDQGFPGPGHYELSKGDTGFMVPGPRRKSFGTGKKHARPLQKWKIHPGPERYRTKPIKCMQTAKPSWMFTSGTKRLLLTRFD